jgi:hypothetical protein
MAGLNGDSGAVLAQPGYKKTGIELQIGFIERAAFSVFISGHAGRPSEAHETSISSNRRRPYLLRELRKVCANRPDQEARFPK